MSRIDELTESISGASSRIDEATGEVAAAAQESLEIATAGEALGSTSLAEGMGQVKEQLDALAEALRAASERATDIQVLARSVAEGT